MTYAAQRRSRELPLRQKGAKYLLPARVLSSLLAQRGHSSVLRHAASSRKSVAGGHQGCHLAEIANLAVPVFPPLLRSWVAPDERDRRAVRFGFGDRDRTRRRLEGDVEPDQALG